MTEPEIDIIAKCISDSYRADPKPGDDIASLADAIVNALDDAGYIIVKVDDPPLFAIGEDGVTVNDPNEAANDVLIPFAGFIDVPEDLKIKE